MTDVFRRSATYIIFLLLGIWMGCYLFLTVENLWHLSLASQISIQIDPFEIISVITTIILALYVGRFLSKKDGAEKSERELLIKYFTDFDSEYTEKVKSLAHNGVKLDYVNAVLKRHGMRLQRLLQLATEQRFVGANSPLKISLTERMKEIKELLTKTPRKGAVEDGVRYSGGTLSYSNDHLDKVVAAIFNMNCEIFKLLVEINRTER